MIDNSQDTPIDRLTLLEPGTLDDAQKRLHERMMTEEVPWAQKAGFQAATPDGRLLGPFNALLYNPTVGQAYLDLFSADRKTTSLSKRAHEIVILTVGVSWQAAYEIYAHTAVGRQAGLSDAEITALASGRMPEGLSAEEQSAYEFTRQLTTNHHVEQATYTQAVAILGDKGVVDLVMLTGLYLMTSATLNAFAVPAPGEAPVSDQIAPA